MAVKHKDIDFSAFDNAVKAVPKSKSADDDFSAFDNVVKKKESGENSGETSGAISPSTSQLPSQSVASNEPKQDWSGIENTLQETRHLYDEWKGAEAPVTLAAPADLSFREGAIKTAKKSYDIAKDRTNAILSANKDKINKPITELLDSGKYKDFFDASGNFKYDQASQYIDGIVKANNGGQYLRDQMTVALKQAGQYKLDEPTREKYRAEEYAKSGIDISKYGKNVFSKATALQKGNLDLLEAETKQKVDEYLNTKIKPEALKIGAEFIAKQKEIQEQVASGQLQPDVAQEQLTSAIKKHKSEVAALNKFYQDGVRGINVKAQDKFARIDKEMKSIAAGITGEDVFKSIPDDGKKKIVDADARVEARIQNGKNEARKSQDAALSGLPGIPLGGLFAKSTINGWYSGLANIGQYLGMKGYDNSLTNYLKSKQYDADVTQTGQYEYGNGETLERMVSGTGSSLGASAPILLPSVAITLGTGGLGLPEVGSAIVGGLVSYEGEKAQNTGEVYKQMMEQTGDSQKAYEAAARYEEKQKVMMPLYFLEGASIQNLIKGKGLKKALIGQAQELGQELPTEYWQNYTQAQETEGYKGNFAQYIKENPETAIDVITSTVGQGAIMSAGGKIFQAFNKNIPQAQSQYYTDIVAKQGAEFAAENLQKQFATGVIDDNELQQGMATIQRAAEKLSQLAQVDIKDESAKNYIVLSDTANQLADNATKTKDEGMKIVYEKKLEETQQAMEAAAGGQEQYVILKNPGGSEGTKVIPIQQIESLRKSGMLDQMIHLSDGVEVKGNEALDKELKAKKAQLGNPANAPEGMYTDIEEKDTEEKPTEADRPIIDRVKEYGGEGIQRTIGAHESEGKHTEAMDFLKEQSLDAPNALKKQLGMRKNLAIDIIAENNPTEIDEAIRKWEDKLDKEVAKDNSDPKVVKEIDQHLSLLDAGLKKANERLSPIEETKTDEEGSIEAVVQSKPKVRVTAKEMKAGQPSLLDEQGNITYDKFKNELMDSAANVKDNSLDFRLTVPGLDQAGITQAVKNIREGKPTKASEKLESALKEMHDKGVVSINRGRGDNTESVDIPIKDWAESSKESRELADKFDDEVADIINTNDITENNIDSLKHLFNGFPYDEGDFNAVKSYLRGQAESSEQTGQSGEESQKRKPKKEKPVEEKPELKPEVKKLANELANLLGNVGLDKDAQNKAISLKDLGIEKGDKIKTVLDKVIEYGGEFTEIFKYLRGLPDIDSLKFDVSSLRYREGEYVPTTNLAEPEEERKQVRIDKNAENAYYAIAHEMEHFLTLDSETVMKYGDKKKISTLQDIYEVLKKKNEGTTQYGFTNFTEFLAELAINSDLRKEVGDITTTEKEFNDALGKSKSVLEYIHDFFRDLFEKLFGASNAKDVDFSKPLIENAAKLFTDVYFSGQKIIPEETTAWKALGIQQIGGRTQFENAALENPGLENNKREIIADFVKSKLSAGESEENIKDALVANGLTVKEAESFFKPTIRIAPQTGDNIADYQLTNSGRIGDFLSGKTIESVFGESPDGDQQYAVQTLSDMLQDGRNMISIAQAKWGPDIASYGKPLFEYIQNMSDDASLTNKKAVLLATFLGEIKEEGIRNPDLRGWLSPLESSVEAYYQRFMNKRGKELAAGRLLRLYRDKYLGDVFADRILEDEQIRKRNAIRDALGRKVDDDVAAKPSKDRAAPTKKEKKKAEKSLKQEEAQNKADSKLKDLENRLGKNAKQSLVDKITSAIKKINCK